MDSSQHIDNICSEAETASRQNSIGQVYKFIRRISGKTETPSATRAKLLDSSEPKCNIDLLRDLATYFSSLLNADEPSAVADVDTETEVLEIDEEDFTMVALSAAISSIKLGKSSGDDGIAPEVLVHGNTPLREKLKDICNETLRSGKAPDEWKQNVSLRLPRAS